ncbi:unnamed protein product, partial [Prorocentrum cordatum]
ATCEAEVAKWNHVWRSHCKGTWPGAFKSAGLGVENENPRVLRNSSAAAVGAFAQLLTPAEASLLRPTQINLLLYYFVIRKAAGGLRPIGEMPTLVRLWEVARFNLVSQWTAQ